MSNGKRRDPLDGLGLDDLEALAAAHRVGLVQALAGLSQGVQPTALMGSQLAQTAASTAMRTAKANPLASALVATGLAMLFQSVTKAQPKAPAPEAPPAEVQRETLHAGLDHLPPEARKRVIRKRIEALEAQEEVEKRPSSLLGLAREHRFSLMIAAAGVAFAAHRLWPKKAVKARETRDQRLRAAQTQLDVEEARLQPFPEGPTPTHHYHNHDRI